MESSSYAYDSPGMVSAVFLTRDDADKAYKALLKKGYSEDEISVLMSDETLNKHLSDTNEHSEPESTPPTEEDRGKTIGGTTGALTGLFVSLGLVAVPGLGISIAGPVMAGIAGALTGRTLGGIIGSKIPATHSDTYEEGVKEGGIIISVDPKNRAESDEIIQKFQQYNGRDILTNDGYSPLN
ncbi:hypothetical protein DYBT9623_01006 [Dyadobacter sp. CECT 9623]|uniref:DUF1269 domain-containing protein n=1 Tax=Dyadobacter linearis TaxID=2823330 RepID=A0ABM8ULE9_9BACT|nr:general stress protein [Dyadobacter sp. CECT 9623]CAG5068277.1 hypothetical protein DYBT9623_01006 [Dyadobacter sp. CECT 9623]